MSWFAEFSEKAENILNSIDKNAAKALNKTINNQAFSKDSSLTGINNSSVLDYEDVPLNEVSTSISAKQSNLSSGDFNHVIDQEINVFPSWKESSTEYLRNEMLQNEIHSLNNEIALLLNRVKIAEQRSSDIYEQLTIVEKKNVKLEEQLYQLIHSSDKNMEEVDENGENENEKEEEDIDEDKNFNNYEHYDKQIQDLIRDKNMAEEMIRKKEDEIIMLKSRLSQKTYCFSADELQSRLRALTITLVEKQSALESIMGEKSSLQIKLIHLQKRYDEALGILRQSRINLNDTDDVKAQIPIYQLKSIVDRYFTLVSSITSLHSKRRIPFKKVPIIKLLMFVYIICLHIFVMLSLNM